MEEVAVVAEVSASAEEEFVLLLDIDDETRKISPQIPIYLSINPNIPLPTYLPKQLKNPKHLILQHRFRRIDKFLINKIN